MRKALPILTFLLLAVAAMAPVAGAAGEEAAPAAVDSRYPVPVTPEEALRQKAEMRDNLIALRLTLEALSKDDFPTVEKMLKLLRHHDSPAPRPGLDTEVYRKLDAGFQGAVEKAAVAARARDTKAVLHELGATVAFCQSCHQALRQEPAAAE